MKKITFGMLFLALMLTLSCQKIFNGNEILINEDITENTTWEAKKTYVVEGIIAIHADLTIEPGTTIKFKENSGFIVGEYEYGSLLAEGTEEEPIIFTSFAKIKSLGDWEYIEFAENNSSSRSSFAYCTIEYGGNSEAMLYVNGTTIKMNNCTIQNSKNNGVQFRFKGKFSQCNNNLIHFCGKYPVVANINAIHTLDASNTILADNGYGILVTDGDEYEIDGQYTWQKFDADYYITESFSVSNENSDASLTINPGCNLLFSPDCYLYVGQYYYGKLVANGTADAPISFTSSANSPAAGDWGAVYFDENTSAGSILNYCNISYGSHADWGIIQIWNNSNTTITNCKISYSLGHGIYINNSNVTMNNNTFMKITGDDIFIDVP